MLYGINQYTMSRRGVVLAAKGKGSVNGERIQRPYDIVVLDSEKHLEYPGCAAYPFMMPIGPKQLIGLQ
jgi:hypothetical protein